MQREPSCRVIVRTSKYRNSVTEVVNLNKNRKRKDLLLQVFPTLLISFSELQTRIAVSCRSHMRC